MSAYRKLATQVQAVVKDAVMNLERISRINDLGQELPGRDFPHDLVERELREAIEKIQSLLPSAALGRQVADAVEGYDYYPSGQVDLSNLQQLGRHDLRKACIAPGDLESVPSLFRE